MSKLITRNDLKAILDKLFPNDLGDYVVEEGKSGIWTYRKWKSGKCDLWGVSTGTEANYATFGSFYGHTRTINFPFPLKEVLASYSVRCGSGWGVPGANFPYSHTDNPDFISSSAIYCLASTTGSVQVTYDIVMHGLWK